MTRTTSFASASFLLALTGTAHLRVARPDLSLHGVRAAAGLFVLPAQPFCHPCVVYRATFGCSAST